MAILAAYPLSLASVAEGFAASSSLPSAKILVEFVTINMVLMLFVLIPLAPLDGENPDYLLPPSMQSTFESGRPYGPMILIVVAVVLPYFGIDIIGRSCALLDAHDEFPGRLSGEAAYRAGLPCGMTAVPDQTGIELAQTIHRHLFWLYF
jgi:hypothetical protein